MHFILKVYNQLYAIATHTRTSNRPQQRMEKCAIEDFLMFVCCLMFNDNLIAYFQVKCASSVYDRTQARYKAGSHRAARPGC